MAEPSRSDEKVLKEARERFKRAVEAEADQRKLRLDDRRFYAGDADNGWQWPDEWKQKRAKEGRPCLTINKLPQHIKQVSNDVRQNRPQGKVRPVDDKSDPKTAQILEGVCRHIENNSNADYAYDTAVENSAIDGLGYWRILTDYVDDTTFDQEFFIKRIRNTFSVYLDPAHQEPDGSDAQWAFITVMIPREEAKRHVKAEDVRGWESDQKDAPEWYTTTHVRGAEYFCIKYTESEIVSPDGKAKRTVRIPRVHWYKLVANKVIDYRETPFRWIPIVKVLGEELDVDGEVTIKGMVRNAKDAQRQYNVSRSAVVERNGLATKAPWTAPAEAIANYEHLWQNANKDALAVLPWNHRDTNGEPIPAPQRVAPPDVPAGFVQDAMLASDDLKATMGQYDASLGAKSNEQSGRAILARQREGDIATFNYVDNLARGIRHTYRILIDAIPKVYDTQRVLRIMGVDGTEEMVRIDPTQKVPVREERDAVGNVQRIYNLGVGRYDVAVTVGPSFTTKRQEQTEAMTQLIQAQPNLMGVIGDLYVKGQDWHNADEMAKRLKATLVPEVRALVDAESQGDIPPEARLAIEQATAQAQQLAQQLQVVQQAAAEEVAKREQRIEQLTFDKGVAEIEKRRAELARDKLAADKQIEEERQRAQAEIQQALQQALVQRAQMAEQGATNVQAMVGTVEQSLQQLAQLMAQSVEEQRAAAQRQEAMLQRVLQVVSAPKQVSARKTPEGWVATQTPTVVQ